MYTHHLMRGGAERVWVVLANGLAARGHNVLLAVDSDTAGPAGATAPQVRVVPLGGGHRRSVLALARLLRQERPDVALAAVSGANLKLVAARVLAASRVPAIISYHGIVEGRSGWLGWAGMKGLAALSRLTSRTVAVSDGLRQALIDQHYATTARTLRLYNPVDLPEPAPLSRAALAGRPQVVLSVGRLAPDKGMASLVAAFAALERRDARLVIVGEGPERSRIEAEARRLGVAERVELPGFVAEPWRHYAGARAFALMSPHEAFGNVIVEALAHGLPVVASQAPGPSEILDRGALGTLVPAGDVAAMTRAIASALDDPGDPAPRQLRARVFSREAGVDAWAALIEQVIRERGGK